MTSFENRSRITRSRFVCFALLIGPFAVAGTDGFAASEAFAADNSTALKSAVELPIGRTFRSHDTIPKADDQKSDAAACLKQLLWSPQPFDVSCQESDQDGCNALLRFPSARTKKTAANDNVAVEWYAPSDATPDRDLPAIVVVHESGRGMKVGRMIARGLRDRGLHAFMVQLPFYGLRRPQTGSKVQPAFETVMGQGIADVRRTLDAVRVLPGVDPHRISLQGTSLGGFLAATTIGLDDRYFRTFVLLAGGDLAHLIETGENETRQVRALLEQRGLNHAARHELLDRFEPNRLAHRIDPERLWLFSATFDTTVPPRHTDQFARAANVDESHHIRMPANHYSGIIFLPQVMDVIAAEATVATDAEPGSGAAEVDSVLKSNPQPVPDQKR